MINIKELYKTVISYKKSLAEHSGTDRYYVVQDMLKVELNQLLRHKDFLTLTKKQIVNVLALCSTHRPEEPFRTLMRFSED